MLTDEELSPSVQAEDLIVQFLGDIFGFGEGFHAGVVDDNIELAEGFDGFLEKLRDLRNL